SWLVVLRRDVRSLEAGDTLQLDRGLAAIERDEGVAAGGRDVVVRLQVVEGVALEVQVILAGDEVLDDVRAARLALAEEEQVVAAAAPDGAGAAAADDGVVAGAAVHDGRAGAADELGRCRAALQRYVTADRDVLIEGDFARAAAGVRMALAVVVAMV